MGVLFDDRCRVSPLSAKKHVPKDLALNYLLRLDLFFYWCTSLSFSYQAKVDTNRAETARSCIKFLPEVSAKLKPRYVIFSQLFNFLRQLTVYCTAIVSNGTTNISRFITNSRWFIYVISATNHPSSRYLWNVRFLYETRNYGNQAWNRLSWFAAAQEGNPCATSTMTLHRACHQSLISSPATHRWSNTPVWVGLYAEQACKRVDSREPDPSKKRIPPHL